MRAVLQMLLALFAMITAGSLSLGVSSPMQASIERVTLLAGRPGNIKFELSWIAVDGIEVFPYYTLSFDSEERPFFVNGEYDPYGFFNDTQESRFVISQSHFRKGFITVKLHITNVYLIDAAVYVFTLILFDYPNGFHKTLRKEVEVRIARGPAKCEIKMSNYSMHLREVHCNALMGDYNTTITCYQNDKKAPYMTPVAQSGQLTTGVFWLYENSSISCCSHDTNTGVNTTFCNHFTWPEKEELGLITPPGRKVQETENGPSSLSPMVTNSGSAKQEEIYCTLYYVLLFRIIMFVV